MKNLYEDLQLSTVCDNNFLRGFTRLWSQSFDFLHNVHAFHDASEDHVPVIQPGSLDCRDEELRSIGVGTSVGHRHDTWTGVFQGEVFVCEFATVDGFASGAIVVREISTLAHEIGDDTVESGTFVTETFFSSAQRSEVFGGFWHYIATQLQRRN